ncbi:MAG: acyl-CoA thioesterase [Solirubrobacterales bacterium]|nr:acyl-CoA thioesterase [Solirubrobacterales bacterium]
MISASPSASVHRRIEFSDVDSSGRYHYGTVIRLLEAAEVELLAGLGLLDSIYTSMPRAHLEIDYSSTLYFMDEVDVTIEVAELGRTSVTFAFRVERGGEECARGRLVTVFVNGEGSPTPWPEEARAAFGNSS